MVLVYNQLNPVIKDLKKDNYVGRKEKILKLVHFYKKLHKFKNFER